MHSKLSFLENGESDDISNTVLKVTNHKDTLVNTNIYDHCVCSNIHVLHI